MVLKTILCMLSVSHDICIHPLISILHPLWHTTIS